jgi:hypothetical protein
MQLLLVAQKQISPGETSGAIGALKGFLLGVRALMALQMLEAGKRAGACCADVRPRLLCLWRRYSLSGVVIGVGYGGGGRLLILALRNRVDLEVC